MEAKMAAKQAKLLTVASNGQISIGKTWAGRQIVIEEIGDSELHIKAGSFVPDSQKTFNTVEAKEALSEFNNWSENKPKSIKSSDVFAKLRKQKTARGK